MKGRSLLFIAALAVGFLCFHINSIYGQGVTTSSMSGVVKDKDGAPVYGANVIAKHVPSGTLFGAATRADGRYNILGMRVGGPYSVTVSYVGYKTEPKENITLTLGQESKLNFVMYEESLELGEVEIVAERNSIINASRTGAATSVSSTAISSLPTINRRIEDMARLTPQYNPSGFGFSFAGQDNRMNNVTIDGSYFNNDFGLAGQPGDRTGVSPISLETLEQLQVNIAPFDVRQGNFVGAGVNAVTKSGTNQYSGALYYQWRNDGMVGTKAHGFDVPVGTFDYSQIGLTLSGPILKDKLFFFANYEQDEVIQPGTTYRAKTAADTGVGGNVTRVLASDLDALSVFLRDTLGYDPGDYQGYDFKTPSKRFLIKLDYSINDHNKFSVRYNFLDSKTDVLLSNSSSLGNGTRRSNLTGLNFSNSNYAILENIHSVIGELNSTFGSNMANKFIIGYTHHDESRESKGAFFPMVDILDQGTVYTTFGFEPFTPNNELRYSSFQLQDNFSYFMDKHNLTFGFSYEYYKSENVFFPGSQSVYVYNSLQDFYTDARDYYANPNRTVSPVTLKTFQVRWSNIPGQTKPVQPLEVNYLGLYGQDEWQFTDAVRFTVGLRFDVPYFGDTGYRNAKADALHFLNQDGDSVSFKTKSLPDANILFSPRLGVNWDVMGDRTLQVRGGTGVFTGKPAYVWISNQVGNTGVLTGFASSTNTTARPFNPDPNTYKPADSLITGAPASSYELALTDPDFKFPQLWRTNFAVDYQLPWYGLIGTTEFLYSKDINGMAYYDANLPNSDTSFAGADNRTRYLSRKVHSYVDNATVLTNQSSGYSWNWTVALEKPESMGLFGKIAYSYGTAKNTVDPGSIARGSWTGNTISDNPNDPAVSYSATAAGHRVLAAVSYKAQYFDMGSTTFSLFWQGYNVGRSSYVFSGDANGDGGTGNDLIYVPRDASEMNFQEYTSGSTTFTVADQQAAWDAFIEQDDYLKDRRGKYAERNGVLLPMVFRADFSIVQEVFKNLGKNRNALQFRLDILNVGNMLDDKWGVSQSLTSTSPLTSPGVDSEGKLRYRLRSINGALISKSYQYNAGLTDVWRIQLGVRYSFN